MRLGNQNGTVFLESESVDLKITPDREVWVRHIHQLKSEGNVKAKKPVNYKSIGRKVDRGLSIQEKQIFLLKLRRGVLSNIQVNKSSLPQEDEKVEKDNEDDEESEENEEEQDDEE